MSHSPDAAAARVRLGIATPLPAAGAQPHAARRRLALVLEVLGPFAEWVPLCADHAGRLDVAGDFDGVICAGDSLAARGAASLSPVEEARRLENAAALEHFMTRVFANRRLRTLLGREPRRRDLIAFHTAHKLLLLAHSPAAYADLGRLIAEVGRSRAVDVVAEYAWRFASALRATPTTGRHVNVLQHAAGYLRGQLPGDALRGIETAIADYQRGQTGLAVPRELLRRHAASCRVTYLTDQFYFEPCPNDLIQRIHATRRGQPSDVVA
jgi:uncharacterized protein YbgA (DUF1722 family)